MKKIIYMGLASLLFLALHTSAWADTLTLRDGTKVTGTLVSKTKTRITFRNDQGVVNRYSTSKVDTLEITSTGQLINYRKPTAAKAGKTVVLPAGTELAVRTNEDINSSTAAANQTFTAQIERDVLSETGSVTVPRGSPAWLVIRSASGGGAIGSPEMTLDIQSIKVRGKSYVVSTEEVSRKSGTGIGANPRTAEMIGGGAAVGAIIGAIAGKGKGAAIGAAAGAAAGAGVQVLVKGKEVKVPAETVLTFKLDQPVTMQAVR